MTTPLDEAEESIALAVDAAPARARELLRAAETDLSDAREAGIDPERIAALESRIEQRRRALDDADAYEVDDAGAAMNPDEDVEGT